MSMLKAVFEGLLGISMDEHIKKSIPLSSRRMGIFGRTRAASLSTECQGRGTLLGHYAPMYINAPAQERLLIFEELYMNMLQFPADCTHQLLIPGATCGHLLMQNFNNWNAA